ncbi:MAG TPA: serine protease [Aliidongia sp.]|nr:serine protease [Aliidongia sp.]
MRVFRLTAVLCVLGLGGCGSGEGPKQPPIVPSAPVGFSVPTGKVALGPVKVELQPRRGIGTYYRNYDCWVRVRSIMDTDFPSGVQVGDQIRKTLTAAKLNVLPGTAADAAAATGADYYLVGTIPTAHADLCINNFFNEGPADIDAQVAISWKLISVADQQTVFETNTSGTARSSDPNQKIDTGVNDAIADATKQLLQTVTVQQYLTFGHVVVPTPPQPVVAGITPPGGLAPIPGTAQQVASRAPAVLEPILVPVKSARPDGSSLDQATTRGVLVSYSVPGHGDGKGFSLGEGFILTTASSLGDAVSVAVGVSGKSVEGRVIRKDADLDLALLKVDGPLPAALPLHPRRVSVGDRVEGVSTGGIIIGSIAGTRAAGGTDQVKLPGAAAGGPVIDSAGNVIGVLHADGTWTSIGSVFRALNLGAQLTDE